MKHLLIAASVLAMTAGYAAAEISFSGSASAGVANNADHNVDEQAALDAAQAALDQGIADGLGAIQIALLTNARDAAQAALDAADNWTVGDFAAYSSVGLDVAMSGQSDSGLSFGADVSMSAGRSYTLGDEDSFADESGAFGMPTVWVSGEFGKVSVSVDNIDFFDDANNGDVKYEGTFGSVGVGLVADVASGDMSGQISFTSGNLSVTANADTLDQQNLSASYAMGSLTLSASTNQDAESTVGVAYSANGISASATYNSSDESIDLAAGYSANGMSVNVDTNTVSNAWTATASFDLGGGLSLEAGTNYTGEAMVGASMSF